MDSTTFLNRYQLCASDSGVPVALQRGPGGVTYKAENIESDEAVAVKLVPSYSFEPAELQQLETEARAAQQVNHPNVTRLFDFGQQGGDVVFVTEILEGTTLDAWVNEHGPLPTGAVVRIALQIVSGLAAAAFHSVVHRCIQPSTMMIVPGQAPDGEWPFVKMLNFGGVPPTLSASEFAFGHAGSSAHFASPEQLKGYPVDFRSELYSLGCTMWFLLTGAAPGPGNNDKTGRVPKALRPILSQMVALDPMQRPQDPLLLQEQLRDCLASIERRETGGRKFGAPVAATATVAAVAAPSETTRNTVRLLKPLALAAAVLLLAGLAALAIPSIMRSRENVSEIGVPVGVPDGSPTRAVAQVNEGAAALPAESGATETPVGGSRTRTVATTPPPTRADADEIAAAAPLPSATQAAEPARTLVSEPQPTPVDTAHLAANETMPPAVANETYEPTTLATHSSDSPSSASAGETSTAQDSAPVETAQTPPRRSSEKLAQNDAPAEAGATPARMADQTQAQSDAEAETTPERVAASEPKPATTLRRVPAVEKEPKPTATPKRTSRIVRNEVRPAEPVDTSDLRDAPPVPRGAKRARYLGTTPQGDLIFGLPSNERGYVAPPQPGDAPAGRRQRVRRPTTVPPTSDMVLPAEPVGPDGQ